MHVEKRSKLIYYIEGFLLKNLPHKGVQTKLHALEQKLSQIQLSDAEVRINYYNKLSGKFLPRGSNTIQSLHHPVTPKAYYFDTLEFARYFDKDLPLDYVFGDVTSVPESPAIVKSRPISGDNENSVLLNLDKARHFVWVKNDRDFFTKKDMLIGRGAIQQQHRVDFFERYFEHPLCDLGQTNKNGNHAWIKPKISLKDHLDYKFILSLEGNDVATNLKWVMSSNSIAVMPEPRYETWFMEGKLQGGKHYIEIARDYSDLEEKLNFYITHPEDCLEIIKNAHEFCEQFFHQYLEEYCSLRVLKKYFDAIPDLEN